MSGGYRFARLVLVRARGPLVFRAQCEVCAEMGPQAVTGDAAMMWAVLHLDDHPGHDRFRELSSTPYRAESRS
ncbi:DUF7848 domain-containing protein [Streptomyces lonarensis]|uniref:DUF7848 domain-containing protein n=1 Tax=Streptomyces lonarensis TaxID=700599 RepID=A0A7X6HYG9_9ACTN|nr:hypothetical protein [Streptomyces lonarensis]NJQ05611.1 hypothetical protein [Streptomyces lonarensis]